MPPSSLFLNPLDTVPLYNSAKVKIRHPSLQVRYDSFLYLYVMEYVPYYDLLNQSSIHMLTV